MKKILLLSLFITSTVLSGICQVNEVDKTKDIAPTTWEEYTYVTKGLKEDISTGRDIKTGYRFLPIGEWKTLVTGVNREVKLSGFIRDGDDYPCVWVVITKRTDTGNLQFIAIPTNEADVQMWQQSLQAVQAGFKDNPDAMLNAIFGMMRSMSRITDFSDWGCEE